MGGNTAVIVPLQVTSNNNTTMKSVTNFILCYALDW